MAIVVRKRVLIGSSEKIAKGVRKNPAAARSRLRQIREEIVASGERLLSLEEVRREVAERRGTGKSRR